MNKLFTGFILIREFIPILILKLRGAKIGKGVRIYGKIFVTNPRNLIIGENTWIASGSIISLGVKIEKNSVVGAMSFVNSKIGEKELFAGVPAKKIRMLK